MISINKCLFLLLICPIQLLFEFLFTIAYRCVGNYGYAIIVFSLIVNIVVLPLYIRADNIQNEQRLIEEKLRPGINHIRKAFSGDERFMMLQMYYKLNNYHPAMALRNAASLLLQIPFFMAAYNLLSKLRCLDGVPFWFVKDLGQADSLYHIGSFSVNILPILMTLMNVVAGIIYTRKSSTREKVQIGVMAALFLVLLYNSPAGLTFYWMLNNMFSLLKNVVTVLVEKYFKKGTTSIKSFFKKIAGEENNCDRSYKVTFFLSSFACCFLVGFAIPSKLLNASVGEFIEPLTYVNPTYYLKHSVCISIGFFLVWGTLLFFFINGRGKKILSILSLVLICYFECNFMFGRRPFLGSLLFNNRFANYVILMLISFIVLYFMYKHFRFVLSTLIFSMALVNIGYGFIKVSSINDYYNENIFPPVADCEFNLSRSGNNVVVIMLDRATGYTFLDECEMISGLENKYDGFTYYPNTFSYGAHTNIASPALFGGYDYTPYMMNLRSDELLEDKHNEALRVMPEIFSNENYEVTLINPPYAGYQYASDVSIFDDIENTNAYYLGYHLNDYGVLIGTSLNEIRERNLFCFGICYACVYGNEFIFDGGNYYNPNSLITMDLEFTSWQDIRGESYFTTNEYNTLDSLADITNIVDDDNGTLLLMANDLTHGDIIPSIDSLNTDIDVHDVYNLACQRSDGNEDLLISYMANGIALEELGEWFDYLREQGVYDNTRIIIVADHGYNNRYFDNSEFSDAFSIESFNPLLLVKDFDDEGFSVSDDFTTNADVLYFATEGIIKNMVNPYTGSAIVNFENCGMPLRINNSHILNMEINNGTTYLNSNYYDIRDLEDPFNINNWYTCE